MIQLNLPSLEAARADLNNLNPLGAGILVRNKPAFTYAIWLIEIQDDPTVAAQVVPLAVDHLERTNPEKALEFRLKLMLCTEELADIAECIAIWLDEVYLTNSGITH